MADASGLVAALLRIFLLLSAQHRQHKLQGVTRRCSECQNRNLVMSVWVPSAATSSNVRIQIFQMLPSNVKNAVGCEATLAEEFCLKSACYTS